MSLAVSCFHEPFSHWGGLDGDSTGFESPMLLYVTPTNPLVCLGEASIGCKHFFGLLSIPY